MYPKLKPESQMMTYGYKPSLSEGAIKCPIFQTSTFVFATAEEGVAAAKAAGADIVVVCSSDDEYAGLVPVIAEKLKDALIKSYPCIIYEKIGKNKLFIRM